MRFNRSGWRVPFCLANMLTGAMLYCVVTTNASADTYELRQPKPAASVMADDRPAVALGDHYYVRGIRRDFVRRSDQIAVLFETADSDADGIAKLLRAGAALGGFTLEHELGNGLFVFHTETLQSRSPGSTVAAYRELASRLPALQATDGIRWATPVFIETQSNTYAIPTDEVIVRLRDDVLPDDVFVAAGIDSFRSMDSADAFLVRTTDGAGEAALALAAQLRSDPRIAWAEPNFLREQKPFSLPSDPLLFQQWSLSNSGHAGGIAGADANVFAAWQLAPKAGNGITIAIADSGFELAHPELDVFANPAEIPGNGIDDDGNGYADDISGWDFTGFSIGDSSPQADSDDHHGTPVAAIAAGRGNNFLGIAGVAHGAKILPLRIWGGSRPMSTDAAIASAIAFAAGRGRNPGDNNWKGADIINGSWGMPWHASAIEDAIKWAGEHGRNGLGTPVILSSGNGGYGEIAFPAVLSGSLDNVIAVGASTNRDERSRYSQFGPELDFVASSDGGTLAVVTADLLGEAGYSPGDYTSSFGGTSASAPLTSGVAALVLAEHPGMTASELRALLRGTARKVGPVPYANGFNVEYGYGRLDAAQALRAIGNARAALSLDGTVIANGTDTRLTMMAQEQRILHFTLASAGDKPLLPEALILSGSPEFSIAEPLDSAPLQLGESTSFEIAFSADAGGDYATTLSFATNDPSQPVIELLIDIHVNAISIEGTAFEDWNGNGANDQGDLPLTNHTMFLDLDHNGFLNGSSRFEFASDPSLELNIGSSPEDTSAAIEVSGAPPMLDKLEVGVNILHPFVGDIRVILRAPDNSSIVLVDRLGQGLTGGADFTGTYLQDDALHAIAEGIAPYSENYRPSEPLSTLHGIDPNGTWVLEVVDYTPDQNSGVLINWSLSFSGAEPQMQTDSEGRYAFLGLPPDTYRVNHHEGSFSWRPTTPSPRVVELPPGGSVQDIDFGAQAWSTVYGQVYADNNGNGVRDQDEAPIPGAPVFVDLDGDERRAASVAATIEQSDIGLPIPDDDELGLSLKGELWDESTVGFITHLTLALDIDHPSAGDLTLTLVRPDGGSTLLSDGNGWGQAYNGTIFDDDAPLSVVDAEPPFIGAFQPLEPLAGMNGAVAMGSWQLLLQDLRLVDAGHIEHWRLDLAYSPEPQILTNEFGNYALHVDPGEQTIMLSTIPGMRVHAPASGGYPLLADEPVTHDNLDFGLRSNQTPVFVLAPDAISIVPSTPALSTIGVFAASDGDGEPVQYSIVASEMPGAFGIGASSGILSLQVPASDLMQNSSIFVAVGASDPNGARTDTVVRIDLTDSDSVAELFADGFED